MAIKMLTDRSLFRYTDDQGRPHYRAQIVADTAAELAGVTGQNGIVWEFGSAALTADGKSCMLGSDGVWYDIMTGYAILPEDPGDDDDDDTGGENGENGGGEVSGE